MRWGLVRVGGGRDGGEKDQVTQPPIVFPLPPESSRPEVTSGSLDMIEMALKTWQPKFQDCIPYDHPCRTLSFCV